MATEASRSGRAPEPWLCERAQRAVSLEAAGKKVMKMEGSRKKHEKQCGDDWVSPTPSSQEETLTHLLLAKVHHARGLTLGFGVEDHIDPLTTRESHDVVGVTKVDTNDAHLFFS